MRFDSEKTLHLIKSLIGIFRPKFYNVITRVVVSAGIVLSLQSQTDFLDYIAFLIFQKFGYDPNVLRPLLFGSRVSTFYGVILVFMGLTYHVLAIKLNKQERETLDNFVPEFRVALVDQDNNEWDKDIYCRGALCEVSLSGVPEYSNKHTFFGGIEMPTSFFNHNYYKDCLKILSKWGGSELFSLRIENVSSMVSRNVRVEVIFQGDHEESFLDNTNNKIPQLPRKENDRLSLPNVQKPNFDIKRITNMGEKYFEWNVGDVQAMQTVVSKTHLHVRTRKPIYLDIRVFCDEFSRPLCCSYNILPPNETKSFTARNVYIFDKDFVTILDDVFMDGYVSRFLNKKLNERPSPDEF